MRGSLHHKPVSKDEYVDTWASVDTMRQHALSGCVLEAQQLAHSTAFYVKYFPVGFDQLRAVADFLRALPQVRAAQAFNHGPAPHVRGVSGHMPPGDNEKALDLLGVYMTLWHHMRTQGNPGA
jgi:hypothetical protein